jgi:hypothetical protein
MEKCIDNPTNNIANGSNKTRKDERENRDIRLDIKSVEKWWEFVKKAGHCVELRAIAPDKTIVCGHFDEQAAFLQAVTKLHGRANVYSSISPVPIAFLALGANVLNGDWKAVRLGLVDEGAGTPTCTKDSDVEFEAILGIDIDAERKPAEVAATDEELAEARKVADAVCGELKGRGLTIARGMSGNGYYVLVPTRLQAMTPEVVRHRQAILQHLSEKHSTEGAKVDLKVFNPSRIMKVLGTLAMKGEHSPKLGRPHRVSGFVDLPDSFPPEQDVHKAFEDIESEVKTAARGRFEPYKTLGKSSSISLESGTPVERARRYIAQIDAAVSGQDGHKQTFKVAMVLVEGFGLDAESALALMREYNERCEPKWLEKELQHKVESAIGRIDPERVGRLLQDSRQVCQAPADSTTEGTAKDSRPTVVIPKDGHDIGLLDTARGIADAVGPREEIFCRMAGNTSGSVQIIDKAHRLRDVSPHLACSEFERSVRFRAPRKDGKGVTYDIPATCSSELARKVIESQDFRASLPPLRVLGPCPVLLERGGELIVVDRYDRQSGIYAQGEKPEEMGLDEAKKLLLGLVQEVLFASEGDRSRYLANLLTPALILGGLGNFRAPIQYHEADESQAGKGYLHRITANIYGCEPHPINQSRAGVGGLEESFDTALQEGCVFISLDNLLPVRGDVFDSAKLCSFLTESTYFARKPHSAGTYVDPRRHVVMATTNGCCLSRDLINRTSPVRIRKRHQHNYQAFPEGDLLGHVKANQTQYLGAVFAILREWHSRGKSHTDVTEHDSSFNHWAQALDWIVQELLGCAPLLEGFTDVKSRVVSPDMLWLRQIAIAVQSSAKLGEWLTTTELVESAIESSVELPAVGRIASLADLKETDRSKALQQMGAKLARCLKSHGKDEKLRIDTFQMERSDKEKTQAYQYDHANKIKWAKTFRFTVIDDSAISVKQESPNRNPRNLLEPTQVSQEPTQNLLEPIEPTNLLNPTKNNTPINSPYIYSASGRGVGSLGSVGSAEHKTKTGVGSGVGSNNCPVGSETEQLKKGSADLPVKMGFGQDLSDKATSGTSCYNLKEDLGHSLPQDLTRKDERCDDSNLKEDPPSSSCSAKTDGSNSLSTKETNHHHRTKGFTRITIGEFNLD